MCVCVFSTAVHRYWTPVYWRIAHQRSLGWKWRASGQICFRSRVREYFVCSLLCFCGDGYIWKKKDCLYLSCSSFKTECRAIGDNFDTIWKSDFLLAENYSHRCLLFRFLDTPSCQITRKFQEGLCHDYIESYRSCDILHQSKQTTFY